MLKHCNRQAQCPATLADVPAGLHISRNQPATEFSCEGCGRYFARSWCLNRHAAAGCRGQPGATGNQLGAEVANAGRDVNATNIASQAIEQQTNTTNGSSHNATHSYNTTNHRTDNSTTHNTVINHYHNYTVRDVAHPDMDHIPDSLMDALVRDFPGMVAKVAKQLYFDPSMPQNHCIRREPLDEPMGEEEVYRVLQHLRRKGLRIWKKYTYERMVLELLQEIRDIADKHIEGKDLDEAIEREFDRALEFTMGPVLGKGRVRPSVIEAFRRMLLEPAAAEVLQRPIVPELVPDEPAAGMP